MKNLIAGFIALSSVAAFANCPTGEYNNLTCSVEISGQTYEGFPMEKIAVYKSGDKYEAVMVTDGEKEVTVYPSTETDEDGIETQYYCDSNQLVAVEKYNGDEAKTVATLAVDGLKIEGEAFIVESDENGNMIGVTKESAKFNCKI